MNPIDRTDPRASALERLAATRARMRVSLQEAADPRPADGPPSVLMTALLAIPGAQIVVDAVRNWWSQHPLHLATMLASNTARSMVRPMARRSPYSLIIGAMAIGGLLFWVKPWRGLLKPALLAGLVPHLISRGLAHVPVEAWFSALMGMVSKRDATPAATAATASTAAPEPAAAPTSPVPGAPLTEKPPGPLH